MDPMGRVAFGGKSVEYLAHVIDINIGLHKKYFADQRSPRGQGFENPRATCLPPDWTPITAM